ncbi:hypothetical protein [Leptospira kanakyensis]|uniref:hypothetical protein n=1 Tax=Leptospira kanakyensis TaxID=2484968 RepID=UPI00223D159E|nr:hypothetical protein [Leptospira kanakyensis]MCW7468588.1 hypothetical protein [Leptospira kanakyensis]MCW7479581.1 hypothetical protein [Leptospira kanakyensis]
MERSLILTVFLFFLFSLDLFPESKTMKDQIDFSKEKPVHPFYDKFGQNGNLNCKEKQQCMSNCTSAVFVFSEKYRNAGSARQGCIAECNQILCLQEDKK